MEPYPAFKTEKAEGLMTQLSEKICTLVNYAMVMFPFDALVKTLIFMFIGAQTPSHTSLSIVPGNCDPV